MRFKILIFAFLMLLLRPNCALKDSEYHLMPNLYGLEDYDSCIREENGIYCVASLGLFADPGNNLMQLIKKHSEGITHYNNSNIYRGICVSKSCKHNVTSTNIEEIEGLRVFLGVCLNEIIWKEYGINATLDPVFYCDRHGERVQIDSVDWAVAGVFAGIIALCVLGTSYDVILRKSNESKQSSREHKYLLCFSMFKNVKNLMRKREDPQSEPLNELYGVRTVIIGIIVCAHMVLLICSFNKDPDSLEKAYDNGIYYIYFNGMMVVQVFFFLSGFMLTYLLQGKADKMRAGWSMVPKIIVLRWCRLMPVCAVMIAVTSSWVRHAGSGPLWKMAITNSTTAHCRSYWWSHLLCVNNFIVDNKQCLVQTWHIAADMQLFILGLVVHVATRNRGRILVLSVLLILGMMAPAFQVWLRGYDAFHMLVPENLRVIAADTFYYMHNRVYTNLPCFLLGMGTGYLGHGLQNRPVDLSKNMKLTLRFLSWWIVPLFTMVIYSGRVFYTVEMRASLPARMAYAAIHRTVLGFLCSAWMLGLMCRCNDVSRVLFKWSGWEVACKLSYCVFTIHIIFFHFLLGIRKELIPVSLSYVFFITLAVLAVSYIVAVPMYLMVEAPFNRIIKTFMENREFEEDKVVKTSRSDVNGDTDHQKKYVNGAKASRSNDADRMKKD